jgi:putative peptidoglycan lipid II flippase
VRRESTHESRTEPMPRIPGAPGGQPPYPPPAQATQRIPGPGYYPPPDGPVAPPYEAGTEIIAAVPSEPATPSLARASGSMVIATAVSRITGFLRQIVLVGVIGIGAVNDSYNVANNMPNIVYELLMGGVLAAVVIPTLVRAQREDADDGVEFTQRLLTVSMVLLGVGTVVAVICAPLLTDLYFSKGGADHPELTTAFSRFILPEILFYGIFGLLSGILNSRHNFKPAAWAPVLNNLIMFATLGVYAALPGEITLDPGLMTQPKLLVLGIGTTLGVVVQALVLVPPLLRMGFRFHWRWGWDRRLGSFGRLALWLVLYTLVSQVSLVVLTKIATAGVSGTYTIFSNSWLLLQVPYGILTVSLLTAIMPRLSKAAAEGDVAGIKDNLSVGSRMSIVMLLPLCAIITVLGPQIGEALFAIRPGDAGNAAVLGLSLTTSAFGVLFYSITMLQMRVFYAMNDARTPTVIITLIVVVKVALFFLVARLLPAHDLVYGLTFINSLGYVFTAAIGQYWLSTRVGTLGTPRVLRTMVKVGVAAAWGSAAALLVNQGVHAVIPASAALARAWIVMVVGGLIGLVITIGLMMLLRVSELSPLTRRVRGLVRRGHPA